MGNTFEPVLLKVCASLPFTYFEELAFVMLPDEPRVALLAPVVRIPLAKSRVPFTVMPALVRVSPLVLLSVRLPNVLVPIPVIACADEPESVTVLPEGPVKVPLFCKVPPTVRKLAEVKVSVAPLSIFRLSTEARLVALWLVSVMFPPEITQDVPVSLTIRAPLL